MVKSLLRFGEEEYLYLNLGLQTEVNYGKSKLLR